MACNNVTLGTYQNNWLFFCTDASVYTANATTVDFTGDYYPPPGSGSGANYRYDWSASFQIKRGSNWITYGSHSGYTTKNSPSKRSFSLSRVPTSGAPHTGRVRVGVSRSGSFQGYMVIGYLTIRK